jgi:hypothetical protein
MEDKLPNFKHKVCKIAIDVYRILITLIAVYVDSVYRYIYVHIRN